MSAPETLVIVGVGLIGGSIGLAARRYGRFSPIIGVGRELAHLERAHALGCIDDATLDLAAAAKRADIVVFCTPVDVIAGQVLAIAPQCRPGTLLLDAGSTKSAIVEAVEAELPEQTPFVGAHPLAGSEKRGPEHARADLFDDRLTVLTPTDQTPPAALARATQFWESLGSRVQCLSPVEHDEALALTSHLPHLLAAALAGVLPPELRDFTASGFRDTTRIAAGDPRLWTAIFAHNRLPMIEAVEDLQLRINAFKEALLAGDFATVERLLTEAKKVRDDLGN